MRPNRPVLLYFAAMCEDVVVVQVEKGKYGLNGKLLESFKQAQEAVGMPAGQASGDAPLAGALLQGAQPAAKRTRTKKELLDSAQARCPPLCCAGEHARSVCATHECPPISRHEIDLCGAENLGKGGGSKV